MAVALSTLSHRFVVAQDICTLFVELPFLSSFQDVELDVGREAVRIALPGESAPRHVTWPAEVEGRQDVENSSARFSRKNEQLVVKMPLLVERSEASTVKDETTPVDKSHAVSAQEAVDKLMSVTGGVLKNVDNAADKHEVSTTATQHLRVSDQKVQGSGWNANSWHWEERPMIKWSQSWFEEELNSASLPILDGLAHVRFLDTSEMFKGDVSLMVRKGRPVVLYELSGTCRWVTDPRAGSDFHTRGKIWIKDWNSEEGAVEGVEAANIEVDVSIDTSEGRRVSKAVKVDVARYMRLTLKNFLEALVSQAAAPKKA